MFETINVIVAIVLAMAQFIYFWFILFNKPINVKATDTLRKVIETKKNLEILLLVVGVISIIFFYICILKELIIGVYVADVFIFFLVGAPVIADRIERKENILKEIK